ncbi:hypothetical protein K2173_020550 [Erythroxylum novogranatense]|uniref:Uncharacterized protein n=1 Tax=Erythroxylum novogranatense TaxID=1862640 RepID=A0AAV8TJ90_9ROSI|nr:hypothetical protein K2173_020550 [Erythroxylum novogranatense]
MEVRIVSRELIRPSSLATDQHEKPHKLSLFDQLTPATYVPFIFFYTMKAISLDTIHVRAHLRKSLSETLAIYYPLSGRTSDNKFLHNFNEGVPFVEALVNCRLTDFLKHHEIESLNHLIACQPCTKELITSPVVTVQLNMFTCGGIAVGVSVSHKIVDGQTLKAFINSWAAISRGNPGDVVQPDLNETSLFFPPRDSFPRNHMSLMENLWFEEDNYVTRRFVFDAKAIATLKAKSKVKPEAKPTTIEVLTCFIWKSGMNASKAITVSPKASILVEALNLRPRTKPPMSSAFIGNVFWWAIAVANPSDTNTELAELVDLLHESIALYNTDFTHALQGDSGFEAISEFCNQLEELFSTEKPDIFAFTSWLHIGLHQLNFGWGEPIWFANIGKAGPAFRNLTVFVETKDGKGIEAWITMDEKRMSILEKDVEFLAFAHPNKKISSL